MNKEQYLKRFRVAERTNERYEKANIIAKEQNLSPMLILKIFKDIGERATQMLHQESKGRTPLFMYLYKKEKESIVWK